MTAALLLLDERPMHGYELITELEARSDGRWRPSPGTMYPALNRMEERGLVDVEEIDGKRQFSLTEAGRTRVAEYRDAKSDDEPAPWDDNGHGERGDLRGAMAELVGQARQIGRFGTPEQVEQAKSVLADTKRKLYAILAAEPDEPAEPGDAE
ncbi:PadR family transcriptional regulator [Ilumatobacter coccineus]|uniref:PadR family transcriptional regulator n=1 Tax=Ilumatobacter coccineus TaxID=467094 RepID=UPI00138AF353|nr:PadR family transcriptional regulator [Ilumatobacter coccineus]